MRVSLFCILFLFFHASGFASDLLPVDISQGWPTRTLSDIPPTEVTLETKIVWSLDCGEDSEPLIGCLDFAAPGQDGRLFIADSSMGHILQISASGEVEASRGRSGEGPGEFKGLYRIVQLPDGRLGAVSGAPAPTFLIGARGELIFVDKEDQPAGNWWIGGDPGTTPTTVVRGLRQAGNHLLVATDHTIVSPPKMICVRELSLISSPQGDRRVLVRQLWKSNLRDLSWLENDQFETLAYGRFDLALDGRIAFAPERDRWAVAVGGLQGEGEVWQRSLQGSPRTSAEREAIREEMGESGLSCVSNQHPVIGRVRWRPNGNLWVEPWGVDPRPGCVASFDEFAKDGRLLRRVHIAAAFQLEHGHLQILNDGRLVWFEGFEYRDETFEGQPRVYLLEVIGSNDQEH